MPNGEGPVQKVKKRIKWYHVVAAVLVVAVLAVLFFLLRSLTVEDILNFTPDNPILAALVLLLIYCIKNILMFIPVLILYIAAGIMFPAGWAIVVTYICLACELSLGYLIGRKLGAKKVRELIEKRPKANAFFEMVGKNHATACFITRLVPMPVPIDLMSMFYGASGVPFWQFLFFSLLGLSGPMIPFVVAGQAIANPFSAQFLVPLGVSLGISGGVFVGYMLWQRKKKRTQPAEKREQVGGHETEN